MSYHMVPLAFSTMAELGDDNNAIKGCRPLGIRMGIGKRCGDWSTCYSIGLWFGMASQCCQ